MAVRTLDFLYAVRDYVVRQAPGECWYIGGAMRSQAEKMLLTDGDLVPLRSALNRICRRNKFGPTLTSEYNHLEQDDVIQVLDDAITELLEGP